MALSDCKIVVDLSDVQDDKGQKGKYQRLVDELAQRPVDAANSYAGWVNVHKTEAERKLCQAGVNVGIRYALAHVGQVKHMVEEDDAK
jgi:hypothetical protein